MVLKIGIISDREKRALRYPRSFLAKRVKRLECIYWTEIELSFAGKQRDENENVVPMFTRFPLLRRRKSRSRATDARLIHAS